MDQKDSQHELRRGELPTEHVLCETSFYLPLTEVRPEEDRRLEFETSLNSMLILVVNKLLVFSLLVDLMKHFTEWKSDCFALTSVHLNRCFVGVGLVSS